MKRTVALLVALLAIACTATARQDDAPKTASARTTSEPRCYEDDPCFDCTTMGNRLCGPTDETLRQSEACNGENLTYVRDDTHLRTYAADGTLCATVPLALVRSDG